MPDVLSSQYGNLTGSDIGISDVLAYLRSKDSAASSNSGYLLGNDTGLSDISVYLHGGGIGISNAPMFAQGNVLTSTSQSVYIVPVAGNETSRLFSYCYGIMRSTVHSYVEGVYMSVDYIWLKTSDGGVTKSKKFKVIAQDYDDGTPEKAEEVNKTVGGGIDHSVGAVYMTWAPIIRVRHTESAPDFGNMADLEYFYSLNNPNGTPSNNITLIDHHQTTYIVHTVGKLTKNLLSCEIEGSEAWYLYKINFLRVQ